MNREFQARFTVIVIGLFTLAAIAFAGFNYKQEHQTATPDDEVRWREPNGRVIAERLNPNGPAAVAGVRKGDILLSIGNNPSNLKFGCMLSACFITRVCIRKQLIHSCATGFRWMWK